MTRSAAPASDVRAGYHVVVPGGKEQADLLGRVIPPRRGPTQSVPGLTLPEGLLLADAMFDHFELTQYDRMVTAEMRSRPVPHVFKEAEVKSLNELYAEWLPDIVGWLLPQLKAPYQTYNKVSKVGWPGFFIPPDKASYVARFMPEVLSGDLSRFNSAFIVQNVRLQVDPATKKREFIFCEDQSVYSAEIGYKDKLVKTPIGPRSASRTRLVFNLPVYNLIKQTLDSAIIDVYGNWPAFKHNMFGGDLLPVRGTHICLDVKHFERHTSTCNRLRAEAWGGVYAQCSRLTATLPFAVPTADWKGARFLYVNREDGWTDQYGSGDSAVSPSQKEIMHAIYAEFFHRELGYPRGSALQQVAQGGDHRMTIRNFGDDNSIDGEEGVVRGFLQFAEQYLHVEEEVPPKFLGFVWYEGLGWRLPIDSYLTKSLLNERRPNSNFRKFPFLGWVERRNIFRKLGHPSITQVFEYEDVQLERLGLPWYKIVEFAEKERKDAFLSKSLSMVDPLMLQNKEYLMTAQQKVATGTHTGLTPSETGPILKKLISRNLASKLLV